MYQELNDNRNNPYFALLTDDNIYFNSSKRVLDPDINYCNFHQRFLKVTPRITGSFSNDLTTGSDDVIIALISLLLLLVIDGIVTTILLRTSRSRLRPFSFSVKLVLELVKDLNLPALQRRQSGTRDLRRLPRRLIISAVALLTFVFGLEVIVLILTEPHTKLMYNTQNTLRVLRPVTPQWRNVRFNFRASLDRPCSGIVLLNVDQKDTRINACVTSNLTGIKPELFQKLEKKAEPITLRIETYIHDYGMDHQLRMGDIGAEYISRAYFSLSDQRPRLMIAQNFKPQYESKQVENIHRQYIGYLFSIYKKAVKDNKITVDTLNAIKVDFTSAGEGPPIFLAKVQDKARIIPSRKYVTESTAVFPRGQAALRVGHHLFRTSLGVLVVEGNATDLFLDSGIGTERAVLWHEDARSLNWLTLIIVVIVALAILIMLRLFFKPVAAAEVAAALVKEKVRADLGRSPAELGREELGTFRLYRDDVGYALGAETGMRLSRDYRANASFLSSGTTEPISRV